MFVVKRTDHGMQGRILVFQEDPFECQTNYAGLAGIRCNFDVQDLRRVLPEHAWAAPGEPLPHLGDRPDWGYMNHYEWDGTSYVERHREGCGDVTEPVQWDEELRPEDWRKFPLAAMSCDGSDDPAVQQLDVEPTYLTGMADHSICPVLNLHRNSK